MRRSANTHQVDDYAAFAEQMKGEGGGGFADIYWCGNPACETKIREETKATCRAIPLNKPSAGQMRRMRRARDRARLFR